MSDFEREHSAEATRSNRDDAYDQDPMPSQAAPDSIPGMARKQRGGSSPLKGRSQRRGKARGNPQRRSNTLRGKKGSTDPQTPETQTPQTCPLAELNPQVAAQVQASTGEDVGTVTVEITDELQGHRGAAEGKDWIGITPEAQEDNELLAHEAVHIIQARGPKNAEKGAEPTSVEDEAVQGAKAIVAGKQFSVQQSTDGQRVFEETVEPTVKGAPSPTPLAAKGTPSATTPLGEKIEDETDAAKIISLLRQASKIARDDKEIQTIVTSKAAIWMPEQKQLADLIIKHGPEPLWPQAIMKDNLGLIPNSLAPINLLELNEGYRDHEAKRDKDGHRTSVMENKVETYIFPGTVPDVVLVMGGIHGTETQGQSVTDQLLKDMQDAKTPKPHYTVILIRSLFPDNTKKERRHVNKISGKPHRGTHPNLCDPSKRKCIGVNRNFPGMLSLGNEVKEVKGLKDSLLKMPSRPGDGEFYLDANGEEILPENIALIKLMEQIKPLRLLAIHGTSRKKGMFSVDKVHSSNKEEDKEDDKKNRDLSLNAAISVANEMGDRKAVQRNKLIRDRKAGPKRFKASKTSLESWGGTKGYGISLGGYASREILGVRPAISTFTIEVPKKPKKGGPRKIKLTHEKEVKSYAKAIQAIFFNK